MLFVLVMPVLSVLWRSGRQNCDRQVPPSPPFASCPTPLASPKPRWKRGASLPLLPEPSVLTHYNHTHMPCAVLSGCSRRAACFSNVPCKGVPHFACPKTHPSLPTSSPPFLLSRPRLKCEQAAAAARQDGRQQRGGEGQKRVRATCLVVGREGLLPGLCEGRANRFT